MTNDNAHVAEFARELANKLLVATNHDGLVTWCSDWSRIDEAPGLRKVFLGPETYGHVAYYLVEGGAS